MESFQEQEAAHEKGPKGAWHTRQTAERWLAAGAQRMPGQLCMVGSR